MTLPTTGPDGGVTITQPGRGQPSAAPKPEAQPKPEPAYGTPNGGGDDTKPYRPAGGSRGGGAATRHPAMAYSGINEPEAYRAYCIALTKWALAGAAGSKEATGTLKVALKKLQGHTWTSKAHAMRIMRRAHRRYEAACRAEAKASLRMHAARLKADEVLMDGVKKSRGKSGSWKVGGSK